MSPRRQYTVEYKLQTVNAIIELTTTTQSDNPIISIRKACAIYNIDPKLFRQWKQNYTKLVTVQRKSIKKLRSGKKSSISKEHEQILIQYIHCQRQIGEPVTYTILESKLSTLDPIFQQKSDNAKKSILRRFIQRNQYTYKNNNKSTQRTLDPIY